MSLIVAGPYDVIPVPTRRGLSTAFCQRQTGRWSPTSGWSFDQEFRGLSAAVMQNLANLYANAGIEYELTYQNGIATLRTTDTTGNVTIDVWEIKACRVSGSVFGSPKLTGNVTANDLKVIARAYLDGTDLASAVTKLNAENSGTAYTAPNFGTASAQTKRLWDKVKNGEEATFFYDQYSLLHTTNASNRGFSNVADVNVNCIYTQSQFLSEIQNGTYWVFPAPTEIIGALTAIFTQLTAVPAPANYLAGALKGGSSRVTTANNRVNISTEYLLGNIDQDNYYTAT